MYQNSLECFTFFTQEKDGPRKTVHECVPNCFFVLVSPCCERWFQRLHACGISNKNLTNSGPDFFLSVIVGFPRLFHTCVTFFAIFLSHFLGEECVPTGFHQERRRPLLHSLKYGTQLVLRSATDRHQTHHGQRAVSLQLQGCNGSFPDCHHSYKFRASLSPLDVDVVFSAWSACGEGDICIRADLV